MEITGLIEHNPTIMRLGLFFEFNDARSQKIAQNVLVSLIGGRKQKTAISEMVAPSCLLSASQQIVSLIRVQLCYSCPTAKTGGYG